MLASITSNPGAIVNIKINIKIKILKPLKLKTNTTYCRFQTNSTIPQKNHNQGDPDQDACSGLHPSIMHMELGKKYFKIFGVI